MKAAICLTFLICLPCWFLMFSDEEIITRLQSSRLVAISKNTGEIIYDGDANDEG
jgi:hypothetical protein